MTEKQFESLRWRIDFLIAFVVTATLWALFTAPLENTEAPPVAEAPEN